MFDDDDPREDDLLDFAVRNRLVRLCTNFTGTIVEYDGSKSPPRAVIQPGFKSSSKNQGLQDLPQIHDVPVLHVGGASGGIKHPIEKGDVCVCFVSQRRLTNWLAAGGQTVVDPFEGVEDRTRVPLHDINDAIALVGLRFEPNVSDDTIVANARALGKVKLGSASASHPVAKGDRVDSNFNKVETFATEVDIFLTAVASALGITYPPPVPPNTPGLLGLLNTASNKVDTE